MDKETIEKRIEILKTEKAQALQAAEQMMANVHALNGAIQDCEYWLNEVENKI